MLKPNLKLSPPWVTFYREVAAMFSKDDTVKVIFDDKDCSVNLYVEDSDKADALTQILVNEKVLGAIKVKVRVIPANNDDNFKISSEALFLRAFKDNPVLSYTTEGGFGLYQMVYVVFEPEIVQFFNDDISDVNGLAHMLYSDIAKDIFRSDLGANFCIDSIRDNFKKPLGEWP